MTTQTVCSKRHRWAGMAEMAWVGGGGRGRGGGVTATGLPCYS